MPAGEFQLLGSDKLGLPPDHADDHLPRQELVALRTAIRRLSEGDRFPRAPRLDPLRPALARLVRRRPRASPLRRPPAGKGAEAALACRGEACYIGGRDTVAPTPFRPIEGFVGGTMPHVGRCENSQNARRAIIATSPIVFHQGVAAGFSSANMKLLGRPSYFGRRPRSLRAKAGPGMEPVGVGHGGRLRSCISSYDVRPTPGHRFPRLAAL